MKTTTKNHTRTHYKEKLIISLLDLEQNKKSITYKAHSEEKTTKWTCNTTRKRRNKTHKSTQIHPHTHIHNYTDIHPHQHVHTEMKKKTL